VAGGKRQSYCLMYIEQNLNRMRAEVPDQCNPDVAALGKEGVRKAATSSIKTEWEKGKR